MQVGFGPLNGAVGLALALLGLQLKSEGALVCSFVMSECMSVTYKSIRPSWLKSKNLMPIAPQGVLGNNAAVFSKNPFQPGFRNNGRPLAC